MLLDYLIYNVLDVVTHVNYVENGKINVNQLLKDAKLNVFVCEFWHRIFKTYPAAEDYKNILYKTNLKEPSLEAANAILQSLWVLKLGPSPRIRVEIPELLKSLESIEFLKNSIIDKLEFRHRLRIDRRNFVLSFLEQVKHKKEPLIEPINPFSGFEVVVSPTNSLLHIVNSDNYFLKKLLNHPVIVSPNPTDLAKYVPNDPIVFTRKPAEKEYKYMPEYMHLIPKIAPWCLCIDCDAPLSCDSNIIIASTAKPNFQRYIQIPYKTKSFWEYQVKHRDNVGQLLFIEFIHAYVAKLPKFHLAKEPSPYVILLVDNRENELSVYSARAAVHNAPGWHLRVITSQKARDYYARELPGAYVTTWPSLDKSFDIDIYNDILEDLTLWESLAHYTHVLTIQDDGLLLRPGISNFLEYDYVGAPWLDFPDNDYIKNHIAPNMVGNGGLSLRTTQSMLRVLREHGDKKHQTFYHNINRMPEDVWFVKYLTQQGAKIPPPHVASKFSIEETIDYDAIGCHKAWVYNPPDKVAKYFNTILSSI